MKHIEITCDSCGRRQKFLTSELVSELSIKDDRGNVVEASPEVVIDSNTLIQCDECGRPIVCTPSNARVL